MQESTSHLPPLAEYLDPEDVRLQPQFALNFPSKHSWGWALRKLRGSLTRSGALILVAGRQKLHPGLAERVILEEGQRAAVGGREGE